MNFWQRMLVNQALAFLQSTLKNPKSIAKEIDIVKQVNDLSAQVLVMNGEKPSAGA